MQPQGVQKEDDHAGYHQSLHLALLRDNEKLALEILDQHVDCANMVCCDRNHDGESPLHLAIFNGNFRLVRELVSRGADPNARCTGTSFSQAQGGEGGVLFYYGEYALSLAARLGMEHIVRYLVENGAELDNQDSKGNTVLHVLSIMEHADAACSMARLVLKLVEEQLEILKTQYDNQQLSLEEFVQIRENLDLEKITNNAGLTPVKLAADSGNLEMFQVLLDPSRKQHVLWKYGPVSECLYDLTDIDSTQRGACNGLLEIVVYSNVRRFYTNIKYAKCMVNTPMYGSVSECLCDLTDIDSTQHGARNGLLEIVVYSNVRRFYTNIKAAKMVQTTPIKQLLNKKWTSFVRGWFLAFALAYLVHIIVFTICCWYRPLRTVVRVVSNGTDNVTVTVVEKVPVFESYNTPWHQARLAGEMFTLLVVLLILYVEISDIIHVKPQAFGILNGVGNGPFRFLSLLYSCAVLILLVFRLTDHPREDVVMSLALVFGWMLLLYFSRGSEALGPFTVIIQQILAGDIVRFFAVYLVCLLGYTAAFYITFEQADEYLEQFRDFEHTMLTLFKLTLGVEDVTVLDKAPNPAMAVALFVSFLIFSFLLMTNLLIGMMGETLSRVSEEKRDLWKLQRACLILLFERRLPSCLRRPAGEYVDVPGFDPNTRYLRVKILGELEARSEVKFKRAPARQRPSFQRSVVGSTKSAKMRAMVDYWRKQTTSL
ncbi:transient receptor potential cation channel subfamily V member 6-like [Branchiostoma floridae]|uniref:Transient receptor potential cation channel subfamily V member 6-like n=1 Tax=Branchiostoma floridae TaxID=7739 RepID=A0A9J7K718_BRAFL|nr:transient receptor potential cation channel subfamily V member 6-like [Branchiostoma floridae]